MRNIKKIVTLALIAILLVGCGPESTKKDSKNKETSLETKTETISKEISKDNNSKKEVSVNKEESEKESKKDESVEEITKSEKTDSKETEETSVEPKAENSSNPKGKTKEVEKSDKDNSVKEEVVKKTEVKMEVKEPVKKKSNDEIAKEVLNGSWGSGQDRKNRLESAGYNYSEVQALVNDMVPAPVIEERTSSSTNSDSTSSRPARVQANNTIIINGYELSISNVNTQARLDARYQELVNWGPNYVGYKTVGGGSIYLAVHVDSYGWLVQQANSITLKDINGNVKTYHRAGTLGPVYGGEEIPDYLFNYLNGAEGDAIAIQTCVSAYDNNTSSYVHIFR